MLRAGGRLLGDLKKAYVEGGAAQGSGGDEVGGRRDAAVAPYRDGPFAGW